MNPHKVIVSVHPITGQPLSLKWYRGASRYNNGATKYGRKYEFRNIIANLKVATKTKAG